MVVEPLYEFATVNARVPGPVLLMPNGPVMPMTPPAVVTLTMTASRSVRTEPPAALPS